MDLRRDFRERRKAEVKPVQQVVKAAAPLPPTLLPAPAAAPAPAPAPAHALQAPAAALPTPEMLMGGFTQMEQALFAQLMAEVLGPPMEPLTAWTPSSVMEEEGLYVLLEEQLQPELLPASFVELAGPQPNGQSDLCALASRIGLLLSTSRGDMPLPLPMLATSFLYEGGVSASKAGLHALAKLLRLHPGPIVAQLQRLVATGILSKQAASWAAEAAASQLLCTSQDPGAQAGATMWLPSIPGELTGLSMASTSLSSLQGAPA